MEHTGDNFLKWQGQVVELCGTWCWRSVLSRSRKCGTGPPDQFFFSELQIQISAGQFWQHNRGTMAIRWQPLVGSACWGCQTKGLDIARRAMSYLLLTYFFCLSMTIPPPRRTLGQLTSFVEAFSPILPPRPSPSSRQSLLHRQ